MTDVRQGAPRRRALLLTSLGSALLLLVGVVACQSQPEPSFGEPPPAAVPSSAPAPVPSVPVRRGALPAGEDEVPPTRLRIPALDLNATVAAVGIDRSTGDFAVPPSVDRVGWYRFGPGFTAESGSIVVAGHVDSAEQGKGAFFRLGSLDEGDEVVLTGASGETRTFRVTARQRYDKTKIPLDKYFARDGAPRLTLITCGGPFDAETGHYRDNVVVSAEPEK